MKDMQRALPLVAGILASLFAPAQAITPSQWAARNLAVPDGPRAGERFDLAMTPYLAEVLDFFSSECPDNKCAIRKSAQTGFTLLAIAAIGHSIDCEPCRIMVVQPTDSALSEFNREKLQPAINQTAVLRRKVVPQTSRSAQGSTVYTKRYPGGSLTLAIATSTADLRGKTIKKVIKDEASEYPADLDGQGSPHGMIEARYTSFLASGEWKELSISTPTIKGDCWIDEAFHGGDQRYWHVPCPGCGGEFYFCDGSQFQYERQYPFKAHYVAPCCGTVIDAAQRNSLVRKGRWVATEPGPGRYRSYHFDAFSSPFVPWDKIAQEAIAAEADAAKQKTFHNLTLGRAYEVKGDAPDHVRLMALREDYDRKRIPPLGLLLVASADVQANGIYVEVLAIAPDRQSWVIEALVLDGDTSDPERGAFAKLTEVYEAAWPDSFGGTRRVDAMGVDSGFRAHVVYAWTRGRPKTFALKGGDGWSRAPLSSPSLVDLDLGGKRIKQGASVWTVGGWSLKAQFYADLRKLRLAEGAEIEPAGACHFGRFLDEPYFVQLTNEHLVDGKFKGRARKEWKERGPNHFLDCRIYNLALADYLGLSRMTQDEWRQLAKLRGASGELQSPELFAPESVKIAAAVADNSESAALPQQPKAKVAGPVVRRSSRSSFMN